MAAKVVSIQKPPDLLDHNGHDCACGEDER